METIPSVKNRNYGLDQLRAILMLLGIPYHAALVLGTTSWIYNSKKHQTLLADIFTTISHSFRMECFFFLSGYFLYLVLKNKGVEFIVKSRVKKVLIPFITAILIVTIPQLNLVGWIYNKAPLYDIGSIISHLWFLLSLLLISFLFINSKIRYLIDKLFVININPVTFIASVAMIFYCMQVARKVFVTHFGDMPQLTTCFSLLYITVHYSVFFAMGYGVGFKCKYLLSLLSSNKKIIATSLVILLIIKVMASMYSIGYIGPIMDVLIPTFAIILLFNFFSRDHFTESKLVKKLVDASLVVYIFHHFFIILLAYILDDVISSSLAYYASIISLSTVLSFFIYWLLSKAKPTRFIFGIR